MLFFLTKIENIASGLQHCDYKKVRIIKRSHIIRPVIGHPGGNGPIIPAGHATDRSIRSITPGEKYDFDDKVKH